MPNAINLELDNNFKLKPNFISEVCTPIWFVFVKYVKCLHHDIHCLSVSLGMLSTLTSVIEDIEQHEIDKSKVPSHCLTFIFAYGLYNVCRTPLTLFMFIFLFDLYSCIPSI